MTVRKLTAFIMMGLMWGFAMAENVRLELSRATISMDETVELLLRQEGQRMFRPPEIPLPEGLEIRGTSQRTQIINGQAEFTLAYTLVPSKPGTFQIGPFRVGKDQEIHAQTLTVTPAAAVRASEDLFATLTASVDEALVRETIELTLTFFSTEPIGDINLLDFPEEGFELTEWQEIQSRSRVINGTRYQQKRFVARLTPTQPGTLVFDPTFRIEVQEPGSPRSMLFGSMRVRTVRIQLQEPLTLEIQAPPAEGRPEGFTGHIGSFRLEAEISPSEVRVGDPITVRVSLEGSGSLKQALPPHYEASADFKVYQANVVTEDLRRDGLGGRKVLEQVVIPTSPDLTELPELTFHYYHPESRSYKTLTAGPFPVTITGEGLQAQSEGSLPLVAPRNELEALGEDLVYLKLSPGRLIPLTRLTPGAGFATGAGLPFALWALSSVWMQQRRRRSRDPGRQRRDQAPRRLRKHLADLDAVEDLWIGIWDVISAYLRDRLTLPAGELEQGVILSALPSSVSDSTRAELSTWIGACERARFGGGDTSAAEDTRQRFRDFMIQLDREIGS